MGAFGPIHWVILAVVALLLFGGRGKLSGIMGDAAKGIKAFKEGMKDDPADKTEKQEAKGEVLPRTDKEKEDLRS